MSKKVLVHALKARGLSELALRAESGEFSDFASKHAAPVLELVKELTKAGAQDLAQRAREGDFDHDR
jgi:hypothetical protein